MTPTGVRSPERQPPPPAAPACPRDVALRPVGTGDGPFLLRVYAGTRAEELALTGWDDAQKAGFVAMQFEAQRRYYLEQFPDARYDVIVRDERPVGRLIVDRGDRAITILDIALLPEHRGAGVGTTLLTGLLDEGSRAGVPLRIHVERDNRALRLYHRLGFRAIHDSGVYILMERPPHPCPGSPAEGGFDGRTVRR